MDFSGLSATMELPEFVDFICCGFLTPCKRGWFGGGGDPGDLALTVFGAEIATGGGIGTPESRMFA